MPSRRPLIRFGLAIQAILLLALQVADGSGVHRCPDHDSGLGVLALGAAPPSPHQHAGHHGGGPHDGPAKHQGVCPCLGACHSVTAALAPAGIATLSLAPTRAERPVLASGAAPRSTPSHLRPFSIGPPRSVPSDIT